MKWGSIGSCTFPTWLKVQEGVKIFLNGCRCELRKFKKILLNIAKFLSQHILATNNQEMKKTEGRRLSGNHVDERNC